MTKGDKKKRKRSMARRLLDTQVMSLAASGEKTGEIAEELGISRQTVSNILNSDEAKKLVELGDTRLRLLMTKAIDTLEWAMDNKAEFGLAGAAIKSAITVLKNMGLARENVDVKHSFPKPTIIQRADGTQVIMGASEGEET